MLKNKKLIKKALKQSNLYSEAEISYFKLWKLEKKRQNKIKKKDKSKLG